MKHKYNFLDYLKDCLFNTTGGFCTLVAIITIATNVQLCLVL